MALVLRLVKNVSSKVTHRASGMQTQLKTNHFVTISHILLIVIYSILSIFFFNFNFNSYHSSVPLSRICTAWTFFGGLADLFITCMIWFVFDDKGTPNVFRHGEFSYAVLNVIN